MLTTKQNFGVFTCGASTDQHRERIFKMLGSQQLLCGGFQVDFDLLARISRTPTSCFHEVCQILSDDFCLQAEY